MSIAINRNTKAIRNSVSTYNKYFKDPNFLVIQCKPLGIDKKLPTCEKKYWKISVKDEVLEMTLLEKKAVDDKITADNQARELKAEQEEITAKQRELAIVPLKESGELPADFGEKKVIGVEK